MPQSAARPEEVANRHHPDFTRRLSLIFLAGLLLRVAYVLLVERGAPLSGDGIYYHEAANLLADGLGFTEPYRYLHGGAQEYLFAADPSAIATSAYTALPVGHIEPTHAGHDHIGEQQIDLPLMVLGQSKGLLARGGYEHMITTTFE